jgi:hypothetical protein
VHSILTSRFGLDEKVAPLEVAASPDRLPPDPRQVVVPITSFRGQLLREHVSQQSEPNDTRGWKELRDKIGERKSHAPVRGMRLIGEERRDNTERRFDLLAFDEVNHKLIGKLAAQAHPLKLAYLGVRRCLR